VALPGPTLLPGAPGRGGYRRLTAAPAETHRVRTDLGGPVPSGRLRAVVAFVQVSDLHVTDAQSPLRAEYLSRLGDADSPIGDALGPLGTYRPQESLTHHVVEAMTATLRRVTDGPVTGAPLRFAVSTGDAADNAQANEIAASIGLLDGGTEIRPDSGASDRWEGVGGPNGEHDPRYWHPDGAPAGEPADRPRAEHGFPLVPGLLDAARRPFTAQGLGLAWHPVHGNHDELVAGTVPVTAGLRRVARGGRKARAWPSRLTPEDLRALFGDARRRPPELYRELLAAPASRVTPDPERDLRTGAAWVDAHRDRSARPAGGPTWYGFDAGVVRALVLDTVNPEGGWQGSVDGDQLAWLATELEAASGRWVDTDGRVRTSDRPDRLVVLFSHHPLHCLTNPWSPTGRRRALGDEVEALLGRFPNLVAWVNGHTHTHTIRAHPGHPAVGGGWWEITTASHVDWPQQARIVELAEDPGTGRVVIATTVVDHAGLTDPRLGNLDDVATLAGWSRELACNDGLRAGRAAPVGQGGATDRNVLLVSPVAVPAAEAVTA
jgi:metallophosphoesterase (TIGR03767 family)